MISFKCKWAGPSDTTHGPVECRKFSLDDASVEKVQQEVKALFGVEACVLKIRDEEGDLITITRNTELTEFIADHMGEVIQLVAAPPKKAGSRGAGHGWTKVRAGQTEGLDSSGSTVPAFESSVSSMPSLSGNMSSSSSCSSDSSDMPPLLDSLELFVGREAVQSVQAPAARMIHRTKYSCALETPFTAGHRSSLAAHKTIKHEPQALPKLPQHLRRGASFATVDDLGRLERMHEQLRDEVKDLRARLEDAVEDDARSSSSSDSCMSDLVGEGFAKLEAVDAQKVADEDVADILHSAHTMFQSIGSEDSEGMHWQRAPERPGDGYRSSDRAREDGYTLLTDDVLEPSCVEPGEAAPTSNPFAVLGLAFNALVPLYNFDRLNKSREVLPLLSARITEAVLSPRDLNGSLDIKRLILVVTENSHGLYQLSCDPDMVSAVSDMLDVFALNCKITPSIGPLRVLIHSLIQLVSPHIDDDLATSMLSCVAHGLADPDPDPHYPAPASARARIPLDANPNVEVEARIVVDGNDHQGAQHGAQPVRGGHGSWDAVQDVPKGRGLPSMLQSSSASLTPLSDVTETHPLGGMTTDDEDRDCDGRLRGEDDDDGIRVSPAVAKGQTAEEIYELAKLHLEVVKKREAEAKTARLGLRHNDHTADDGDDDGIRVTPVLGPAHTSPYQARALSPLPLDDDGIRVSPVSTGTGTGAGVPGLERSYPMAVPWLELEFPSQPVAHTPSDAVMPTWSVKNTSIVTCKSVSLAPVLGNLFEVDTSAGGGRLVYDAPISGGESAVISISLAVPDHLPAGPHVQLFQPYETDSSTLLGEPLACTVVVDRPGAHWETSTTTPAPSAPAAPTTTTATTSTPISASTPAPSSSSSTSTATDAGSPMRQELRRLKQLSDLGFSDVTRNRLLLRHNDGDVNRVALILMQDSSVD